MNKNKLGIPNLEAEIVHDYDYDYIMKCKILKQINKVGKSS